MSFPQPPLDTIDWCSLGFDHHRVNGHVESKYDIATDSWSKPEFVEDPLLRVHGLSPALNWGQQVLEGLKAYRNPKGQIHLFRPQRNARRLQYSSRFVSIPQIPEQHFLECLNLVVALNSEYVPPHETNASMYCRAIAFASSPSPGIKLAKEYTFCVFAFPVGPLYAPHAVDALIIEDFDRAAPLGTGSAKVGGNYAPVMRIIDEAFKDGYQLTLHLDSKSHTAIDEFSTSGFVGAKVEGERRTVVVSDSSQVLDSITCASVCDLAVSFGWKIEKRRIAFDELSEFTEVFAVGTAALLVPVRLIEHRSSDRKFTYQDASGDPNSCYTRLRRALSQIQRGEVEDPFMWIYPVTLPDVKGENNVPMINGKK